MSDNTSETDDPFRPASHWLCPYCEQPYFGEQCDHDSVPAKKLVLAIEDDVRLAEEHEHEIRYVDAN